MKFWFLELFLSDVDKVPWDVPNTKSVLYFPGAESICHHQADHGTFLNKGEEKEKKNHHAPTNSLPASLPAIKPDTGEHLCKVNGMQFRPPILC